jgi:hypothetical protein
MTIQSRMNKEYTTPASAGLAPSEWAANLSNKNPKERNKTQNLMELRMFNFKSSFISYTDIQQVHNCNSIFQILTSNNKDQQNHKQ